MSAVLLCRTITTVTMLAVTDLATLRTTYTTTLDHRCPSGVEDSGTIVTRYGDTCCALCHQPLSWSPQDVTDDLYGDDTLAYARSQALHYERTPAGVDAWGRDLLQAHDGHHAWSCNNRGCTRHPVSMYPQFA